MSKRCGRYWDVDVVRGIAMLMVALYHTIFDLDNFGGYPVDSVEGFWRVFADVSASLFIFLAGLSLTLSYARASSGIRSPLFGKYLRRGLGIFACGMLITIVFLIFSLGYVIFGVLHLIGLSIILSYPFLRSRLASLLAGLVVISAGVYVQMQGFVVGGLTGVLLTPLGALPADLPMPDYRPLLPWFGVMLLGIAFGNAVYRRWREQRPPTPTPEAARPLAFIGRHTLLIYLFHQPIIIALLWATGIIDL